MLREKRGHMLSYGIQVRTKYFLRLLLARGAPYLTQKQLLKGKLKCTTSKPLAHCRYSNEQHIWHQNNKGHSDDFG